MITIRQIQAAVSAATGVSLDEMRGRLRRPPIVQARHIAMWLARMLTPSSFPEIASRFGDVDHSTVINACNRIEERIKNSPEFAAKVQAIRVGLVPAIPVAKPFMGRVPKGLTPTIMAEIDAAKQEAPHCPPYKSRRAWAI